MPGSLTVIDFPVPAAGDALLRELDCVGDACAAPVPVVAVDAPVAGVEAEVGAEVEVDASSSSPPQAASSPDILAPATASMPRKWRRVSRTPSSVDRVESCSERPDMLVCPS